MTKTKEWKQVCKLKYSVGKRQDWFAPKKFVVSVKKQQIDLI